MNDRKFSAFLGFAVGLVVGILCEDQVCFLVFIFFTGHDLGFDAGDDGLSLSTSQGAVDEIVLHIDDDISLGHYGHPFPLGTQFF